MTPLEERWWIVKELIPALFTASNPTVTVNVLESMIVTHQNIYTVLWAWSLSNDGGKVDLTNPNVLDFLARLARDPRLGTPQYYAGVGWEFRI